jgi:hypothetical protein
LAIALLSAATHGYAQSALQLPGVDTTSEAVFQTNSQSTPQATSQKQEDKAPEWKGDHSISFRISLWFSDRSDRWALQKRKLFHEQGPKDGLNLEPATSMESTLSLPESFGPASAVADEVDQDLIPQPPEANGSLYKPLNISPDVAIWAPPADSGAPVESIHNNVTMPESILVVSAAEPGKLEVSEIEYSDPLDGSPAINPPGAPGLPSEQSLQKQAPIPQIATPEPGTIILTGISAVLFSCCSLFRHRISGTSQAGS